MKYTVKFFVIILITICTNLSIAEENKSIVYINMEKVMNQSNHNTIPQIFLDNSFFGGYDELLKQSGLNWTIFRPSLIFGDPRGHGRPEFCSQIKDDMLSLPFPAPLFYEGIWPSNAGEFSMTPIHVENVAEFFVKALNMENCERKIYNLGGPKTLTWKTIIHKIALVSGNSTWKIPTPVHAIKIAAAMLEKYEWFPVTRDQLTMLSMGNICESNKYYSDFNVDEITFNVTALKYLL